MAHNIQFTDEEGIKHLVLYHNIVGFKISNGYMPDMAVCTIRYQEFSNVSRQGDPDFLPTCSSRDLDIITATVVGEKALALHKAILNGVIDLDEGDFVAQSLPADFLQPSPNQVFLQASGSTMTVFHNPCVRMPQVDQIVYGYYLTQYDLITVDEVYVDDTGEWTSTTTSDEIATPLLYCEKPVPPSPSIEALRAASDLQDETTM
jgi:hypothetical protein